MSSTYRDLPSVDKVLSYPVVVELLDWRDHTEILTERLDITK